MTPDKILCVIPSRLAVGEEFTIKIKLKGAVQEIQCANGWNTVKPALRGPFNLAVGRGIKYLDDTLSEWQGHLQVDGAGALSGSEQIEFDGIDQGAFPGDTRPIKSFNGYSWTKPGFHFIRITDPESGVCFWSNPVYVTAEKPETRIFWGDPHWQTIFSDGIRCPEELYAFARDEAFLDFGAISDHMEAVTDRQWDYFQMVTNDYNQPGRFVSLIGQEWTGFKPGHRNIYYRGDGGPLISSTDARYNTLEKLWQAADKIAETGEQVLLIPHHTSNRVMGCDWSLGWNPKYENAVEMYSVWGSSECHEDEGNIRPIKSSKGEVKGQHVRDALKLGYRFGFVGGGDIHDGRPGDCLDGHPNAKVLYPSGLTAVMVPELTRENVFDAMKNNHSYAATCSRIFLNVTPEKNGKNLKLDLKCASEHGLKAVELIRNGDIVQSIALKDDARFLEQCLDIQALAKDEFIYIRVTTNSGDMAWSSPVYGN
jgi:Protein of unknown function (DUF3604)